MNVMKTKHTLYSEYLAILVNHPELIEKTIIKEEYLFDKDRQMFRALVNNYTKNKSIIETDFVKYKDFDYDYYLELLGQNVYNLTKIYKLKALEKEIIKEYKEIAIDFIFKKYHQDKEILVKKIDEVKNIKVLENQYITTERMLDVLSKQNSQVKTGYSVLDKHLRIEQNDLVVLAGGTGTGKTSFALNLLSHMSKENKCVYFNMEMSEKTLYKRLTAIESGLEITKLNNFTTLTSEELKKVNFAISEIEKREIILINGKQTLDNLSKTLRSIDSDKPLLVILDHIGLIKTKGSSLYEKMTNIAKEIRTLCFECNCTIIALCQLSRDSQKRGDIPKLQDLRDSGEIEQSARKVILLHNEDLTNQNRIKSVGVYIAKNDDGICFCTKTNFDVYTQKIVERSDKNV